MAIPRDEVIDGLILSQIASRQQNGPLVDEVSQIQLLWLAQTNPNALYQYMNADLRTAQEAQPEGARIRITIKGWRVLGFSTAEWVAGKLQAAYESGKIIDPDTGKPTYLWPEYPGQFAVGDDATDTVTIRAVKAAAPLVPIWVVIALLSSFVITLIWLFLRQSDWQAHVAGYSADPGGGGGGGGGGLPTPGEVVGWLYRNWQWVALGGVALAAAPFVVRQLGRLRQAEREFER